MCNAGLPVFVPLEGSGRRRLATNGDSLSAANITRVAMHDDDTLKGSGSRRLATDNGVDFAVKSLAVHKNRLFMGGQGVPSFPFVANPAGVEKMAIFDGSNFLSFGGDPLVLEDSMFLSISAMHSFKDKLVVVGEFKADINGADVYAYAHWDSDSGWAVPGGGPGAAAAVKGSCLLEHDSILYMGALAYTQVLSTASGNVAIEHLARFNGNSWMAAGNFGAAGPAYTMLLYQGNIIVAGDKMLTHLGAKTNNAFPATPVVSSIAAWNPTSNTWSALTDVISNDIGVASKWSHNTIVAVLCEYQGDLIVGGEFDKLWPSQTAVNNIAKYSGTLQKWSVLGNSTHNGIKGVVLALAVFQDLLFVGGKIFKLNDVNHYGGIVTWNGLTQTWARIPLSPPFYGVQGMVNSLLVWNDLLFLGGFFLQCT
jgi:hypothetical protein